jgi:hypothetical protein
VAAIAIWLLSLAGCGVDAESVAKIRAANDFHCNEDKVSVESVGGTSYRAKGCGETEVYDCNGSAVGTGIMGSETTEYVCVPEKRGHHDDD